MPVEISLFDPMSASEADLAEHRAVTAACLAVDYPDQPMPALDEYVTVIREPTQPLGPVTRWVARESGRIVAIGTATYPEHENRHLALVRISVMPTHQRQGIGTVLLRAMLPSLGIDGRSVVIGNSVKADASGEQWARKLGFVRTLAYVRQFLTFADVDPGLWQNPVVDGFRLERWIGAAPEALLAEYARARTAIRDAPQGDSTFDDPEWTPERVRAHEKDTRERHSEGRVVVAVHEPTGRVAGFTELNLRPSVSTRALQRDTAVLADFRGHGLGLAVKSAMLRWLTADHPEILDVFTGTSESNAHMIRINHAVGFRTDAVVVEVELGLAELAKRLERLP